MLDELEEEYEWIKSCNILREMISFKKCEMPTLTELSRNVVRLNLKCSLTQNQVPKIIPHLLRRIISMPETYLTLFSTD